MQVYALIYPYAVMTLSIVAALCAIIGGAVTGFRIISPGSDADKTGNIVGGYLVFVIACVVAMVCLYVGGKFVGAF